MIAVPRIGTGLRREGEIVLVERGSCVHVRSNDARVLEEFLAFPLPSPNLAFETALDLRYAIQRLPGAGGFVASAWGRRLGCVPTRDEAVMCVLSHLHWKLAETSRANIFVHAGVVGRGGAALVLPGRSHSGKTRLVAELLRRGAVYLSDEYAVFDGAGTVHPFPRNLHVRIGPLEGRRICSPKDLSAATATAPLPVGLLLFTRFSPGARWTPRSLSPGRALLGLLGNTVCVRRAPRQVLHALRAVALDSPALETERGEADRIAPYILDMLDRAAAARAQSPALSAGA